MAQKHSELKGSYSHSLQPPSQHDFFTKNSWSRQSKGLSVIQCDSVAPQTLTNKEHLGRCDHQKHSVLSKGTPVPSCQGCKKMAMMPTRSRPERKINKQDTTNYWYL